MQQSTVGTATGTTGPYQRCQPQVHADNNTALQVLFVTGRTEHSCGRHPGFVLSSESCPEHISYTPQQVLGHPRAVSPVCCWLHRHLGCHLQLQHSCPQRAPSLHPPKTPAFMCSLIHYHAVASNPRQTPDMQPMPPTDCALPDQRCVVSTYWVQQCVLHH
jgi:hypothetical protein